MSRRRQRGDARRGVEHLWHSRSAAWTGVADDDDVVVCEGVGPLVESFDEVTLAGEDAGAAGEDAVGDAAFDAGNFEDRSAVGGEIAVEESVGPQSS